MAITMALCIWVAVVALGGVNIDFMMVAYALGLVVALAWTAKLFFSKVVSWKHSPVHLPVIAFFIYALARYFTSPIEYESRLELLNISFCTLVYFVCAANFYRSRDRTILLIALMVLALAETGYGFWQFWTKADVVLMFSRPELYHGRASGTYICPNHFAGFLEMVLALLVARLAVWNPSKADVQGLALHKVLIAYVVLMVVGGQMLSLSRASWVATGVGLFTLMLWGEMEWQKLWPRLATAAAGVALLISIALLVAPVRHYIVMTFDEPSSVKPLKLADTTVGLRTIMWTDTVQMIKDRPVFGTGPGTWQWYHPAYQPKEMQGYSDYAHNDLLNLASDYGLVGLALMIGVLLAFFRHAGAFVGRHNSSERKAFAIGSAVAVTIILIHSWFDFNLHIPANALLLTTIIGFTVAMEDSAGRYARVELNRAARLILGSVLLVIIAVGGWWAGRTALGYYYQTQGKRYKSYMYFEDALACYQRASKIDPKAPTSYLRIGDIYRLQSFWRVDSRREAERKELARQAIASYRESLRLNPRQIEALIGLAKACDLAGDSGAAEAAYRDAIALAPTTAYLYQELGVFYRERGEEQKALAALEKSYELAWDAVAAVQLQELKAP